jgi:D-alanine transaminase
MPLPICYLSGHYLPLSEARISPLDRGFLFADSVYEVIPVYAGRPFRLRQHLDRLNRSLDGIRMPAPLAHAHWGQICQELIARNAGADLYIYIQVTRGTEFGRNHAWPDGLPPTLFAYATALEPLSARVLDQGVAAITAADIRWARRDIKSTALLANILLKKLSAVAGAYETIMLENGELTEGSSTTVHIAKDGVLHTPPNGQSILPGTTRDVVEEMAARDHARRRARRPRQARAHVQAHGRGVQALRARARRNTRAVSESLQQFPSDFPIKVMGRCDSDLRAVTDQIMQRHAGPLAESSVRVRTSADGNFLALTYMVHAHSQEQLDAIYRELTACKAVLMAL